MKGKILDIDTETEFESLEKLEDYLYDYKLGMEILERIRSGEEETSSLEDAMIRIGLGDKA